MSCTAVCSSYCGMQVCLAFHFLESMRKTLLNSAAFKVFGEFHCKKQKQNNLFSISPPSPVSKSALLGPNHCQDIVLSHLACHSCGPKLRARDIPQYSLPPLDSVPVWVLFETVTLRRLNRLKNLVIGKALYDNLQLEKPQKVSIQRVPFCK